MNEYEGLTGGQSSDEVYETFSLVRCPVCEKVVCEYYAAIEVTQKIDSLAQNPNSAEFNRRIRSFVSNQTRNI